MNSFKTGVKPKYRKPPTKTTNRINKCTQCRGKGTSGGSDYIFETCSYCQGTGKVPIVQDELTYDINALTERIEEWAADRNLQTADPNKQMLKLMEEVGELAEGMAKGNGLEVFDAIGDIYVVITILSKQLGFEIGECIHYAYKEIKDRKGKMVNGVFVKEEDL